jgi:RHS repeat-associated protein
VPSGGGYEYQYHLKDHLGNVRVTFTSQTTPVQNTAGFENANQATEANNFLNYPSGGQINTVSANAHAGANSQYLNGGYAGQVGLAKSYSVMPGDVVQIQAYAKYNTPSGTGGNLAGFAASLLTAFNLAAPIGGETQTASSAIGDWGALEAGGYADGSNSNATPKVFVTILIFDRDYNFLDVAYNQVGTSGALMSAAYTIREAGYAYMYVSNEHPTQTDVYFDDISMTFTASAVISVSDYYPFGLNFNSSSRENSIANQYLYNEKEKQDELDLNWLDYGARMYMPDVARWATVDPLTECDRRWGAYTYVFNNPLRFIDPDGMWAVDPSGNLSTSDPKEIAQFINTVKSKSSTKGSTIFVHSVGQSTAADRTRNAKAAEYISKTFESLGINLHAEVSYRKEVYGKEEFYTREGSDENDSYVLIGNSKELKKAEVDAQSKGWNTGMYAESEYRSPGTTYIGGDNIHFINTVKMNYRIHLNGNVDDFGDSAQRMAATIIHETGHTKFRDHPGGTGRSGGHVDGTIMKELPGKNSVHDNWMLKRLRELHNRKIIP